MINPDQKCEDTSLSVGSGTGIYWDTDYTKDDEEECGANKVKKFCKQNRKGERR
ncbi:MAG: hypothetical protein WBL67_15140 [Nitrososphaeraceae archaeon]